MLTRNLGKTGLKASVLSLGTGGARQFGQTLGHSINDQKNLVYAALDMGINIFDTSTQYGYSESLLGRCLLDIPRDSFYISTKWPARDEIGHTILDPKKLIASVDKSLQRLQTDYIDIMLFHGIMSEEYNLIIENLYPTMDQLKSEGKIINVGFSSRFSEDPAQKSIELALSQNPELWDVVMLKYGILNQHASKTILPLAERHQIGIINMAAVRVKLPDPTLLEELIENWKSIGLIAYDSFPTVNPLGWLIKGNVRSVIEAGYKFAGEPNSISTVLTGTSSIEHLRMNVESMKEPWLSEDHMDRLKKTLSHIVEYA